MSSNSPRGGARGSAELAPMPQGAPPDALEVAATRMQALVRGRLTRNGFYSRQQTPYPSQGHFLLASQLDAPQRAKLSPMWQAYQQTERHAMHQAGPAPQPHEVLLHRRGDQGGLRYTELYDRESGSLQASRQLSGLQYTPPGGHDMDKNRAWLLGAMHRRLPVRNVAPTALDDMRSSTHPENVSAHTKELLMMTSNPGYAAAQGERPWETTFTPIAAPATDRTSLRDLENATRGLTVDAAVARLNAHAVPSLAVVPLRAASVAPVLERLHGPGPQQMEAPPVASEAQAARQQQLAARLQARDQARRAAAQSRKPGAGSNGPSPGPGSAGASGSSGL